MQFGDYTFNIRRLGDGRWEGGLLRGEKRLLDALKAPTKRELIRALCFAAGQHKVHAALERENRALLRALREGEEHLRELEATLEVSEAQSDERLRALDAAEERIEALEIELDEIQKSPVFHMREVHYRWRDADAMDQNEIQYLLGRMTSIPH